MVEVMVEVMVVVGVAEAEEMEVMVGVGVGEVVGLQYALKKMFPTSVALTMAMAISEGVSPRFQMVKSSISMFEGELAGLLLLPM
jgi:hypothetical protein